MAKKRKTTTTRKTGAGGRTSTGGRRKTSTTRTGGRKRAANQPAAAGPLGTRPSGGRARRMFDQQAAAEARVQRARIDAQRQRYYELRRQGLSKEEAGEQSGQEADKGKLDRPGGLRAQPAFSGTARSRQLKERRKQHDPELRRTPRAGRVARMMMPDEDELGTHEEAETSEAGALQWTHEGRVPDSGVRADTGEANTPAEAVQGGEGSIPDDWESLSAREQKKLAKRFAGNKPVRNKGDAGRIMRAELRRRDSEG